MVRNPKPEQDLLTQLLRHGLEPYLESTRTLVALVDVGGRVVAANPAFQSVRADQTAAALADMLDPSLQRYAQGLLDSARRDHTPVRAPLDIGIGKKSIRYECLVVPVDHGGAILFAEPAAADVGLLAAHEELEAELAAAREALSAKTIELQAVMAQADEMAHTDPLTFLPNRRSILADLQRQVTYSERYEAPLTVSMLDLDRFKEVNDGLGHAAGDKVLGIIAKELRDHIRQPDQIGRYGGDEFLVILANTTEAAASEQAARLCARVRSTQIPFAEQLIQLTLSVGIAQFKAGADDWRTLLERADRALYEAKGAGGDRWVILES